MNTQKKLVLSCIDGSQFSEAVCLYAAWIAKTADAPLKLLHTIEHSQAPAVADFSGAIGIGSSEELLSELTKIEASRSKLLIQQGNLMLQAAKEKAQQAGVNDIHLCQRHGTLSESLVELEDSLRVLVIGIRGLRHEEDDEGVGHQLETTIRSLHKPILVVNKAFTQTKKIMLAYDGSEAEQKALMMVATSPLFKSTPCHLVHVVAKPAQNNTILTEATERLEAAGISVQTETLLGKNEDVLPT